MCVILLKRNIRLFCKVKKRMGYVCSLNNCICILFQSYFATLCWWDGEQIQNRIVQNLLDKIRLI